MPKSTFYNLPDEKKERILEVVIDEFAEYPFAKVSISRIVENAEIAKGSFYQYFEDKIDLFKYIIQVAGEKKIEYMGDILKRMNEQNVFLTIRQLYIAGFQFARDYPKLALIGDQIYKDKGINLKDIFPKEMTNKGNQLFEQLLMMGIKRGEIDPNIDIPLVAMLITSMNMAIGEYYLRDLGISDFDKLQVAFDQVFYVLENGIKKK